MGKPGRGLIPQAGDDAEKVTALAVKRTRRYLAEVRKRYPDAFAQLNRMVRQKGAPGMPDWPDWCWLPMGASYAVASGGGLNRLTATDPRTADMGRLAALAAWRLTKGVYWLEADAQDRHIRRLWKAPGVPADPVLRQERYTGGMPQHCVYVALPQRNRPTQVGPLPWPLGVFIHLEHDVNNGRPELRIVVDTDGTWEGLAPHPVMLDRPTLLASSREGAHESLATVLQHFPGLGDNEDPAEALAKFSQTLPFQVWPVVEAVTDPDVVISRWDMPGERPERARPVQDSGGPRWEPANEPVRWRVSLEAPRPGLRAM
ncbi:hypothetical protein [Streptomyces griseomycini]|uniref:Uncharacterized protein n=1 Tax=Streptomyces griseomycini TaxID=66895 RepID=A0A7W7VA94_9ACTN|nr:hypothetical protein [Streptomyces griseomycini]MBB4902607.1 hypothetical protein [Streptomyces griseomycini]GGR54426.1 hypothetical protein GCM10015536_69770 [Streptomyces griseomycini]